MFNIFSSLRTEEETDELDIYQQTEDYYENYDDYLYYDGNYEDYEGDYWEAGLERLGQAQDYYYYYEVI